MFFQKRWLVLLIAVVAAVIFTFLIYQRSTGVAFGSAVALCPGPDQYGYTCESGSGFAYIDATNDTFLYQDDGIISLDLPFPFIFYGTTYTEIQVSSNGNLQFNNGNPQFFNECMADGAVVNMGDMIAPYWDDLDLRFLGFLEYEIVGSTPDRIFVIEWDDVPRFGDTNDDQVTFEVQLFEKSNDIVFLYQDVTTLDGYNGSSATIGLQSEAQGVALQYGCYQPVVANATGIYIPHPAKPNGDLGLNSLIPFESKVSLLPEAKGHVSELISTINQLGPSYLPNLRIEWMNGNPPRQTEWRWVDLTGNSRDELVVYWHGRSQNPELTQLTVLTITESGNMTLTLDIPLSSRQEAVGRVEILETADLTNDGVKDILFADTTNNKFFVISNATGILAYYPVPDQCKGSWALVNHDDRIDIVMNGCLTNKRMRYTWSGSEFIPIPTGS